MVHKTYALLAQAELARGERTAAIAVCEEGLQRFPADAELLFTAATQYHAAGELPRAEACYQALLTSEPASALSSVEEGVRGYMSRHNLAVVCRELGKLEEAERHWRAAVAERPDFAQAWLGLGELYVKQKRPADLEEVLAALDQAQPGGPEWAALSARRLASTGDNPAAHRLLDEASTLHPDSATLRLMRSQLLSLERKKLAAARDQQHDASDERPASTLNQEAAPPSLLGGGETRPIPMHSRPRRHTKSPLSVRKPDSPQDRSDEVIKVLLQKGVRAESVLDLGCAAAGTARHVRASLQPWRYVGIVADETSAIQTRGELDEVIVADLNQTSLTSLGLRPGEFDLVTALDALGQLYDPWEVLAEAAGLLRAGGHVVLCLPNVQNVNVLSGLARGEWTYGNGGLLDASHVRFFTYRAMRELLTGAGLRMIHTEAIVDPSTDVTALAETGNELRRGNLTLTDLTREQIIGFLTRRYILLAHRP